MKNGRPGWTVKCPPETLRRVEEAVDARARTAREIYDTLNLDRCVRFATFQHWVAVRRRERQERTTEAQSTQRFGFNRTGQPTLAAEAVETIQNPQSTSHDSPAGTPVPLPAEPVAARSVELVIAQCVEAISLAIASGRVGKLDVGKALRSLAALKEVAIDESAERRAAELHELKLVELRRKQAAALDEVSQATGLTDEQLGQIKSRVLGI